MNESTPLLSPEQLAERLQVSLVWIYRHADKWPFTRRLSRKCLRFDPVSLEDWLRKQKG